LDLQGIKSVDLSVGDLLNDFYSVPDYQREYVWTTARVERLLQDISAEFSEKTDSYSPDYFIGTIVTNYQSDNKIFELIDGQQRITTLYIFLVAVRDYLKEMGNELKAVENQLFALSVDQDGNELPRHRVELQYEDSQDVLKLLVNDRDGSPIDSLPTSTRSAANLVQAYRDSRAFLIEELGGEIDQIKKFYAYVTQNVKLIRIRTESIDRALWIFETINERGQGLDAMDLLKNLLFRHAKSDQFEKLKQRWKALIDALYGADERPIGFIRYYLLANYSHSKIQADRVYGWLTDKNNSERPNYWDDPVAFANDVLAGALAYVNFTRGRLEDGSYCRYLRNMWYLSHTARQHLILLLAARSLPEEAFVRLAKEIENLYCVYLLTRQSANKFEKDFVDWAVQLRVMSTEEEVDVFLENVLVPKRHALRREFEFALMNMREENLPKYRLKYVLGKMGQHLDEIAYGPRELSVYMDTRVDIEHILPCSPPAEVAEEFGEESEVGAATHALGNLTLLERTHNAVVSNKAFDEKQPAYSQSNLLMTKGLAPNAEVGLSTAVNRALEYVKCYDGWNVESFNDREGRLLRLAQRVWDVPAATS
jgi:hypothetical protein